MVAVVTHEEDFALRHGKREHGALFAIGVVVDVVLVQKLTVHIDLTQVKVDVHGLARGGDDALDDGLRVKGLLARDDDIADLIVAAEQRVDDEKPVAVLQRRDH